MCSTIVSPRNGLISLLLLPRNLVKSSLVTGLQKCHVTINDILPDFY